MAHFERFLKITPIMIIGKKNTKTGKKIWKKVKLKIKQKSIQKLAV